MFGTGLAGRFRVGCLGSRRRIARCGVATLVAATLSACSPTGPDPDDHEELRAELERSRRLWREQGVDDYELVLERLCFCPPELVEPVVVDVRDGRITAVVVAETGVPVDPELAGFFPDVEGLFDVIEDAIDRDAHAVAVTFDPDTGVPLAIDIDYDAQIADEELSFRVLDLIPLR